MNKNIKRNKYHVDEQTNTVTFKTRSAYGTAVSKFVADVDDLDILACTTWNKTTGANNKGVLIYGSNGESILQTIGSKYVYATNGRKVFLARINQNTLNYCKTNLICNNKESNMMFGKLSRTKPSQNKSTKFLHTEYTPVHGGVYVASISTKLKGVLAKKDGDNPDMHVLNMQYFDATDNNIEFAKKYARGTAVRGVDHIDAFDPEKDARQFAQLMSLCNGLVICD